MCLAASVAAAACSLTGEHVQAETFQAGDDWNIEISPGSYGVTLQENIANSANSPSIMPADHTVRPITDASVPVGTRFSGADYRRIYESIPFNRTEFKSNPSYRHDSTMEIITGNARHQTILRHSTVPVVRPRAQARTYLLPSRYNQRRRGLNHYFRIPYWNWAGLY